MGLAAVGLEDSCPHWVCEPGGVPPCSWQHRVPDLKSPGRTCSWEAVSPRRSPLPEGPGGRGRDAWGRAGRPHCVVPGASPQPLEMGGSPCFAFRFGGQGGAGPAEWASPSPHGVPGPRGGACRGPCPEVLGWGLWRAPVGCGQDAPGTEGGPGTGRGFSVLAPGFPAAPAHSVGLGATPALVLFPAVTSGRGPQRVALPPPGSGKHARMRAAGLRQGFSLSHAAHVPPESDGVSQPEQPPPPQHRPERPAPGTGPQALARRTGYEDWRPVSCLPGLQPQGSRSPRGTGRVAACVPSRGGLGWGSGARWLSPPRQAAPAGPCQEREDPPREAGGGTHSSHSVAAGGGAGNS